MSAARHDWQGRLSALCERYAVPGAVLGIGTAPGSDLVVAHGVLDRHSGAPVDRGSLFQAGSITKLLTAVLVLQLQQEQRLHLASTVADLLPGVRLGRDGTEREVTVEHLLTHTSGVDGDLFTDTGDDADSVERYVKLLADAQQVFAPGAAYSYCNAGFVVLGRIVEVLTGQTWDAALRSRVLDPVGATRTDTLHGQARPGEAAIGHRARPHHDEPVATWALPRSLGPAGGLLTTADDLLALARALFLDDRLLRPEARAAMSEPRVATPALAPALDGVGLAVRCHDWTGGRLIGHDGATTGQLAYLRVHPPSGLVVCLLTNGAGAQPLADQLLAEVIEAHAGLRPLPPAGPRPDDDVPGADEAKAWDRLVGDYARALVTYGVRRDGSALRLLVRPTGDDADLLQREDDEAVLLPARGDRTGQHFVTRSQPDEPWAVVSFPPLPAVGSCLVLSGRVTPRVPPVVQDR